MHLIVSNNVTIKNASDSVKEFCEKNFYILNPEYEKLKRLGKYYMKLPKYLCLFSINGKDVIVPIGLFASIWNSTDVFKANITFCLNDDKKVEYEPNRVKLYDYQKQAIDNCIKSNRGILIAPTGSGKTQMGIALILKLGYKALWLTHTTDLLSQSYDRAREFVDKKYLGKITDGKIEIGEFITFATVQTLAKQDLSNFKNEFNTVVVDECHRLSGTPTKLKQFSKVIDNISARHKYGLTATLSRSDGMEKTTIAYLGDVCHTVSEEDVKHTVVGATVRKVNTGIELSEECIGTDGTLDYNLLLNYLCSNTKRNKIILGHILENKNNSNLILSNRVEHLNNLYDLLPCEEKEQAVLLHSKLNKKLRKQAIKDMQDGNKKYMFATYSLAKEGLDITRLDRLYLTLSSKDKAVVSQSVGRIRRVSKDKDKAVVYDFVDSYVKARRDFATRKTFYKNINCSVIE